MAAKIALVNFGSRGKMANCFPTFVRRTFCSSLHSIAPKSSNCLKAPSTASSGGGSKKSNLKMFSMPIRKAQLQFQCRFKSTLDGVLITYCTLGIVVQVGLNICHKEVAMYLKVSYKLSHLVTKWHNSSTTEDTCVTLQ